MRFAFYIAFVSALLAPRAWASSLAELDAILTEASSLREFLSPRRAELRERYFQALNGYYGDFSRNAYDKIISKLTKMDAKIPGLGARLWETSGLGESFSVEATGSAYGRDLNQKLWNGYLEKRKLNLLLRAKSYYALPAEERLSQLKRFAEAVTRQIYMHQARLDAKGPERKARERESEAFYRALKRSPEFDAASAYVLHRYLQSEQVDDYMRSDSADLILDKLKEMDERPGVIVEDLDGQLPLEWVSLLKPQIPKLNELLADHTLFPQTLRMTNRGKSVPVARNGVVQYDFVPFPRRFHGVWKGVPLRECVGLNCTRFGTVAIADTQLYAVEIEGQPRGFVQIVPGQLKGKTYGSIDFGSTVLSQTLKEADKEPGPAKSTLYERVLGEFEHRLPRHWAGLVVGEDLAINNAGVLPVVQRSASYLQGTEVGQGREFQLADSLAEQMGKWNQGTDHYGDGMIFDAGVRGNQNSSLMKLNADAIAASPVPEGARRKIEAIAEWTTERASHQFLRQNDLRGFLNFVDGFPLPKKLEFIQNAIEADFESLARQTTKQAVPPDERSALRAKLTRLSAAQGLQRLRGTNSATVVDAAVLGALFPLSVVGLGMVVDLIALHGSLFFDQPERLAGTFGSLWAVGFGVSLQFRNSYEEVNFRSPRGQILRSLIRARKESISIEPELLEQLSQEPKLKSSCRKLARSLLGRGEK